MRYAQWAWIGCLLAAAFAGCERQDTGTIPGSAPNTPVDSNASPGITIYVDPNGPRVGNVKVPVNNLAAHLKSLGAGPETHVLISPTDQVPWRTVVEVWAVLAKGKFEKIGFAAAPNTPSAAPSE